MVASPHYCREVIPVHSAPPVTHFHALLFDRGIVQIMHYLKNKIITIRLASDTPELPVDISVFYPMYGNSVILVVLLICLCSLPVVVR